MATRVMAATSMVIKGSYAKGSALMLNADGVTTTLPSLSWFSMTASPQVTTPALHCPCIMYYS